jgi:hypothetical protein
MLAVAAVTAASASMFALATANATQTVTIATHVSIKSNGLTFSGTVTSPKAACVSGRRVTLFRTNGDVLGTRTTGASGRWKIAVSGSAGISLGHFFVKVKRHAEGTAGTIFVCKGARSSTIPFHQP